MDANDEVAVKNKIQVLHFILKHVRFCVNIDNVVQIVQLSRLEYVPNSPPYLLGLMNFAAKSIPLIDLARRLGFENNEPYSLDAPVLLCASQEKTACLVIDTIIGLSDISPDAIQMYDEFKKADSAFSAAVVLDSQISLLINIERVLSFNLTIGEINLNNNKLYQMAKDKHE